MNGWDPKSLSMLKGTKMTLVLLRKVDGGNAKTVCIGHATTPGKSPDKDILGSMWMLLSMPNLTGMSRSCIGAKLVVFCMSRSY